ncbi:MAG: amidohydrolase family protein [Bacteroidales bacterium]
MEKICGNLVDVEQRRIYPVEISICNNSIASIEEKDNSYDSFIMPGFIDSHVHIESSMMTPLQFSRFAVSKGTVAIVTDVHEIANVMGVPGIMFMQNSAKNGPLKIFFTVPSCVPATPFDHSGAEIDGEMVYKLLKSGKFVGLSEMMNYPGVINGDPDVLKKLSAAQTLHLPVDGHAPGLSGEALRAYSYGIDTDHECTSLTEAIEKIGEGMQISIREGSSAKNYDALKDLIQTHPDQIMFCTDDSHPDDLLKNGHINKIVIKAISDGYDLFDVLKAASVNAVHHYKLPVGLLHAGDPADFIRVKDLKEFDILETYINGKCVFDKEKDALK